MNYINNIHYYGNIVVKVTNKSHNAYLNRENKYKLISYFKDNHFSFIPTILDCAFKDGTVINKMKKIENFKIFDKSLNNENFYTLLINTITKFHKIDVSKLGIETFSYKKFFYNLYNNISHHLYKIDLEELDKVMERLDNVKNKCLSHNDLVPNNILYIEESNSIKLIDFDFSMINNTLFDYASFLCESLDDQKDVNIYITSLFKERILTPENVKDFKDEIYYQDRVWLVWSNYCYEIAKRDEDCKIASLIKDKVKENFDKIESAYNDKLFELEQVEEAIQNSEESNESLIIKKNKLESEFNDIKKEYDVSKNLLSSFDKASTDDILKYSNILESKDNNNSKKYDQILYLSKEFLEIHSNKIEKLETRLLNL